MHRDYFFLTPIPPYRLDLTVWTLRRRPDNIVDRWDAATYRRVLSLADGPVELAVTQSGSATAPKLRVAVRGSHLSAARKAIITSILNRLLGLQVDLAPFYRFAKDHPILHDLVREFRGMKPPRFTSAFEGVVNAIACQKFTLTAGIRFLNRLAGNYGAAIHIGDAIGHAFPQPGSLAAAAPANLRELGFSNNKSRAIIELAQSITNGHLDMDQLEVMPDAQAIAHLRNLRGLGRWTAEYVLLRGLGRVHIFPADDVGARNNLQRWLNITEPLDYQGVHKHLDAWRGFGGMVYFHLLLRSLAEAGQI